MRRITIIEETQAGKSKEEKATRKKQTREKTRKRDYIKTLCFNVVSAMLFLRGCFKCSTTRGMF